MFEIEHLRKLVVEIDAGGARQARGGLRHHRAAAAGGVRWRSGAPIRASSPKSWHSRRACPARSRRRTRSKVAVVSSLVSRLVDLARIARGPGGVGRIGRVPAAADAAVAQQRQGAALRGVDRGVDRNIAPQARSGRRRHGGGARIGEQARDGRGSAAGLVEFGEGRDRGRRRSGRAGSGRRRWSCRAAAPSPASLPLVDAASPRRRRSPARRRPSRPCPTVPAAKAVRRREGHGAGVAWNRVTPLSV